jgi:hypothetical protein
MNGMAITVDPQARTGMSGQTGHPSVGTVEGWLVAP